MLDILQNLLQQELELADKIENLTKLYGEASNRTFYRLHLAGGKTFIIMQLPKGAASVSEEITNLKDKPKELPFLNINYYLKNIGIKVPQAFVYSKKNNLIILEDLGDDLLARKVENTDQDQQKIWYQKAIDLLVELQTKTAKPDQVGCIAFQRSFDAYLLNWEFDHFLEYGIECRLNKKISDSDKNILVEQMHQITEEIANLPYGFTHRDFQSTNIMVKENELYLIDFQDALLGPRVYDLVALLRDSYVELSTELVEDLLKYYAKKQGVDFNLLQKEFDLVTCQRKLKDAGRFVYIDQVKNNPKYLKFIPLSLAYVREALERLPEYKELYHILEKYVPEFK
ncbi:MAG: phosphotransferase [Pseudomonadota bacterium]